MSALTLTEDGHLPLPADLLTRNGWSPGTRFACEETHGVLVLRALPAEQPGAPAAPRDPDEIVALRIHRGLTRSSFARQLGVPVEKVRAWEEGHAQPDEGELSRLALLAAEE
ncbi:MAG: helix-turn-helix domain-containing protein [Alphaproteobacteria bacterium]|nr:helix-turn-helix domain-containing protein [Alphaproteobacteria bacterium]